MCVTSANLNESNQMHLYKRRCYNAWGRVVSLWWPLPRLRAGAGRESTSLRSCVSFAPAQACQRVILLRSLSTLDCPIGFTQGYVHRGINASLYLARKVLRGSFWGLQFLVRNFGHDASKSFGLPFSQVMEVVLHYDI